MKSVMRMTLCSLSLLILMAWSFSAGGVAAQDSRALTPTPTTSGSALSNFLAQTPAPTGNTSDTLDTTGTPVVFESYQITFPRDWLTWTINRDDSEKANEQALITLVAQVDAALAADAEASIRELIPPMIIAGVAPETPGGDLIYLTVLEYGYQASLTDLQLPASTSPSEVITALGFPQAEAREGLTAGFLLDASSDGNTYFGGFLMPDLDRLVIVAAVCDVASWPGYEAQIMAIVSSFALSEQTAQPDATTIKTPVPAAATGGLTPGTYDVSQLPYLTPINILTQMPYEFQFSLIVTGTVDLTRLNINPTLEKLEGTEYYPPVVGYASAEPVLAFYAVPYSNVGVVFAGANYVDTVLLVRCPDGSWNYADDVQYGNPDPAVATNSSAEGVYEVWIGSKVPNQSLSGDIYINVQ